jgi:hypothetical protein
MEPRKSASLTVFYFDDNLFYKLVQNAQVNLQHCIDDYHKSVLLKADFNAVGQTRPTVHLQPNREVFLNQIVTLANEGYYIDIYIFTHGNDDKIYFANNQVLTNDLLKSELAFSKTGYHVLPIRMVYQMNCYGRTFNQTWLALGAKVSCGTRWVNFYPNQFNKFAAAWKEGHVSVDKALQESNTESSRSVMQTLIAGDALGRFNFDRCPFGKTVLGDHPCAKSYFDANWLASDEWQHGQSGAENMNYSSFMFRPGLETLTRNNMAPLIWHP